VDPVTEPEQGSLIEREPARFFDDEHRARRQEHNSRTLRWVIEVVAIVAAAFVLALLVQQFVVKPFAIPSPSMEPTLMEGDRVLVNRLVYHFHPPHAGDVIVFHPPGRPGSDPFIKRVVAVAGDTIAVHDGALYVNGQRQSEQYLMEQDIIGTFPETVVPSSMVWAMGDNRNNSGDSRSFGPVSLSSIMGEAFAIYWPFKHLKGL
jgi:signal peptidase I